MPLRVHEGKLITLADDILGQATRVNKISWIKQEQTQ
jgi:hypothetical protein